jgi:outer membrane receptor protein involved in Fe transport
VVKDTFAIRAVVYDDHHGGYIDNVPSTFTRNNGDLGNHYTGILPTAGICPNGLPAAPVALNGGYCTTTNAPVENNFSIAAKNQNPVDYFGARVEALWDITPDWNVLVTESYQKLDVHGISSEEPIGSDFQTLAPLQTTYFTPSWSHDTFYNTAWTLNGKIGPLKAIYTGAYTVRHIDQQSDYSSYSRAPFGTYYQCVGGNTYYPAPKPTCYSTSAYWTDKVRNTHLTEEFRISSPDTWRLRFIAGGYWERFKLYDNMDFDYYSIPRCTPEALAAAESGGPSCGGFTGPIAGATLNEPGLRGPTTAFGEDLTRSYDQTAAFVSVDFDIIPNKLTISGGTRWYQYQETEVGSVFWTFGFFCANVPVCHNPGSGSNIDLNHDKVTYVGFKSRANITWNVTQDVHAYFTFSQGFRPGFFNRLNDKEVALDAAGQPQFREPNSVAPDTLTNYEVGIKSQLFEHRLLLNVSAYNMDWNNVQLGFFNPQVLGNTAFAVNGPNYNVKGFEFQFVGKPAPQWTISGSGSYNHATQSSSPCFVSNIPASPSFGSCIQEAINSSTGQLVSLANPFGALGTVPAFSPAFEGNIRVRYDFKISDYNCYAMIGGNYMGGMWNQPATYPSGDGVTFPFTTLLRYYQPAYATLDASAGFTRDNWRVEIYGSNLTNSHASTFTSSAEYIKSEVPIRPLVVGVRMGVSY